MTRELTFGEFAAKMYGGESRMNPGMAITYVLIEDDDQEFYIEWPMESDEDDCARLEEAYIKYLNFEEETS